MKFYQEIIKKSKSVDGKFKKINESQLNRIKIIFHIPKFHPRAKAISGYTFSPLALENLTKNKTYNLTKNHIFIIDESVSKQSFVREFIKKQNISPIILKSIEGKVKTKPFLDELIKNHDLNKKQNLTLVIIGGGLLLNVGAYLAEKLSANLILFPTTVIAMADGAGGKVRINFISDNRAYKHFYKSFYEPNAIFLDKRFLESLPKKQISIGFVEIIKHGLFQSPKLYDYILRSGKDFFVDIKKLKKAIFWAAALKNVCIDVDVEENENGSSKILRGGHDFSD
ncbi:MAG: hypothetical protein PHE59_04370, partial [Patescibacteria group bacterium]|nr:hypothetical protein [Patescibacteria group bacterium]